MDISENKYNYMYISLATKDQFNLTKKNLLIHFY